jgi:hypothetical protein
MWYTLRNKNSTISVEILMINEIEELNPESLQIAKLQDLESLDFDKLFQML